jgi:hypothetical protein
MYVHVCACERICVHVCACVCRARGRVVLVAVVVDGGGGAGLHLVDAQRRPAHPAPIRVLHRLRGPQHRLQKHPVVPHQVLYPGPRRPRRRPAAVQRPQLHVRAGQTRLLSGQESS